MAGTQRHVKPGRTECSEQAEWTRALIQPLKTAYAGFVLLVPLMSGNSSFQRKLGLVSYLTDLLHLHP
jgi:hypothetical protein